MDEWTYEGIIEAAKNDPSFRRGLLAAAAVCRAQGVETNSCPSDMAAVYIERLSEGQMP